MHGWDPLSALLGASPGSMAQVMALSAEFGADLRGIAIVQMMRVLLIVLGLPAGLALFGSTVGPVVSTRGVSETSLVELAVLVAVSTAAAIAMLRDAISRRPAVRRHGRLGIPARRRTWSTSLPWWAGSAAVLTLGAVAGARFANTSPRMLLSYLGAAFGSFAVAAAVASCFALIVVALLPLRIADVIVAFAPGAQDTMMVLALALHLDPDLCRGAPPGAVPGRELLGRRGRRGASCATPPPRRRWRRPGQGTFDD